MCPLLKVVCGYHLLALADTTHPSEPDINTMTSLPQIKPTGTHLTASMQADTQRSHSHCAAARVNKYPVVRLQSATHTQSQIGSAICHRHRGGFSQAPPIWDTPNLQRPRGHLQVVDRGEHTACTKYSVLGNVFQEMEQQLLWPSLLSRDPGMRSVPRTKNPE